MMYQPGTHRTLVLSVNKHPRFIHSPAAQLGSKNVDGGGGAPAGGEEVPGSAAARGRRRRRPPQHRQVRAEVLRSFPGHGRVLSFCSGWVPRPSAPRLRDRHLHARGSRDARGLRGPPWHHQGRRRAVDDGRPRHRALRDACRPRHLQGPPALGQPRLPKQNDRAEVPGDTEQGHRVHGVGRRRRDGARDRWAGHGRAVFREHADADHVPGLHGARARRRAGAAAGAGVVERVRVRARGRGRVRGRREGAGGRRAPPGAARAGRRRRGGVEQVRQAAPVPAHRRRAHRRARGAARPLRHEHRGGDRRHRQRFRVLHQWLREGQALEIAGDDSFRRRVGTKNGTPRTLTEQHISCTRLFIYSFFQISAIDSSQKKKRYLPSICVHIRYKAIPNSTKFILPRLFRMYSPEEKRG